MTIAMIMRCAVGVVAVPPLAGVGRSALASLVPGGHAVVAADGGWIGSLVVTAVLGRCIVGGHVMTPPAVAGFVVASGMLRRLRRRSRSWGSGFVRRMRIGRCVAAAAIEYRVVGRGGVSPFAG